MPEGRTIWSMQKLTRLFAAVTLFAFPMLAQTPSTAPLRLAVVGLNHGHVAGFFHRNLHRSDIQIVGIEDPVAALRDKYARQFGIDKNLFFASLPDMIAKTHPRAVLVYADTFDHRKIVEECAARGVHVMMEKPLAVSFADALAMQRAANAGHIHVLVNYETTWYSSNKAAFDLAQQGALGNVWKVVAHDGHQGPKEIHVQPEFFAWLTNPKLNGAGALYDFGCYGADLMTILMNGKAPQSVSAVTKQIKPDIYPHVDDEADVILNYPKAVAILQPSWNWPFNIKDMIVYGKTGYVKTLLTDGIEVQRADEKVAQIEKPAPLVAPYDDSIHYFRAVLDGQVPDEHALSSLDTNIIVSEILDAARRSAQTGKTVTLPLAD
jgi:glucose-fructose oxidoreductase